MKGMIKFYNKDKGFGFVVGENNKDYYFNHEVIPFGHMPNSGDMVEFEVSDKPTSSKHKEPTIAKMTMTGEQAKGAGNGKTQCQHCGSQCVPRLYFSHGEATHSVCPFCGKNIQVFLDENTIEQSFAAVGEFIPVFGKLLGGSIVKKMMYKQLASLRQSVKPDFK